MRFFLLFPVVVLGLMPHGRFAYARDAHMESIEWLTADADLVVHGTFVKFQRGVDVGPTGRRSGQLPRVCRRSTRSQSPGRC